MTFLLREAGRMSINQVDETLEKTAPVELTSATFDDFVNDHPVVLVDFWAAWCPPCRRMAPIFEALAADLAGRGGGAKLETEHNRETARRLGIRAILAFVVFRDGKVVAFSAGGRPKAALLALVEPHLGPREGSEGLGPSPAAVETDP